MELSKERSEKILKALKKKFKITTDKDSIYKIVSFNYVSIFGIDSEYFNKIKENKESIKGNILLKEVVSYCEETNTNIKDICMISFEVFENSKDKKENEGKGNEENQAVIYLDMPYNIIVTNDIFILFEEKWK